ncbi:sigma-70 family RNA polymerase sigma factor [Amorphus orientalis]|uniref:RNA polymerase sigma-70 factor (ECF subfamily) n=1 Tax=Amorphus orientalis TaxID=649198 RepID=A0AAE4AR90_9HYPH|nr:sigma-70 family RNA polymerase sigma factor [Amorphus orientalis]MDQ0313575.1 RNA polymerase sigma-70 factor (ECF subfamily) [Amorphus orientalis]
MTLEPQEGSVSTPALDAFEANRVRLFSIAYRMLGSVADAEDAVQDAFLRWHGADTEKVAEPAAYLTRVVTRLALDRLKSASRRRETYVGPWLPEPIVEDPDPSADLDPVGEGVSIALMLALERLSPLERAAFLLHDVFDIGFDEVATALGRTPAACRQLASRARSQVRSERPRFVLDAVDRDRIADAFFAAVRSGDAAHLQALLAEDATLRTDGGGRARAALNVIAGRDRVARFFAGLAKKAGAGPPRFVRPMRINGLAGRFSVEADGARQTMALDIEDGRIRAVYVTRNPDKLRHLERFLPPGLAEE